MTPAKLLAALWLSAAAAAFAAPAVINVASEYPEGPLWSGDALFYAEMTKDRVMVRRDGEQTEFLTQPQCGPTSIAEASADRFLVTCHLTHSLVVLDRAAQVQRSYRRDAGGGPVFYPNDSIADKSGGVYVSNAGTFRNDAPKDGAILYLSADGELRRVAVGLAYPNGVLFDVKRARLLVSEHRAQRILSFPVTGPGRLGPPSVFAALSSLPPNRDAHTAPVGPDGLDFAPDGDVYVCIYGAGQIRVLSPAGAERRTIKTPPKFVTNIAFAANGAVAVTGAYGNQAGETGGSLFVGDWKTLLEGDALGK